MVPYLLYRVLEYGHLVFIGCVRSIYEIPN